MAATRATFVCHLYIGEPVAAPTWQPTEVNAFGNMTGIRPSAHERAKGIPAKPNLAIAPLVSMLEQEGGLHLKFPSPSSANELLESLQT